MDKIILGLLIAIGVGAAIWLLIRFIASRQETTMEVQTDADDPVLSHIADFRSSLLNNIVAVFVQVWHASAEDVKVDCENTDWDNLLMTISFLTYTVRAYTDWRKQKMKITFSITEDGKTFCREKIFRIKNHTIDYDELLILLKKWDSQAMSALYDDLPEQVVDCVAAAKDLAETEDVTDEAIKEMLLDVWEQYRISRKAKHIKEDMTNYTKLSAYLLRMMPEEFLKRLNERKEKLTDE